MHQSCLDQLALVKAQPQEGTGRTRILRETDAAVRQEECRLNSAHRIVDQSLELLPLLLGDGGPQVLYIAANRRNGRLSKEPKSKERKNRSRRNSTKHGILTSALLIRDGAGAEETAEFDRLFADLRHHLKPVGAGEKLQVETIAVCYWRERRALQCEAGFIRHSFLYSWLGQRRVWDAPTDEADTMKLCLRMPPATNLDDILRYRS